MADIVVELPGGGTATFPEGMSPQRIEFELKRIGANQPSGPQSLPEQAVGAAGAGVNWLGTRTVNAAANVAGMPNMFGQFGDWARSQLQEPGRWLRRNLGLPEDAGPHGAPAMGGRPDASGAPVKPPSGEEIKRFLYDEVGLPEVNLPGRAGRIIDAATEAGIGALPFGPGALAPGIGSGAGSEIAGQVTEGTPWESYARVAGGVVGGGLGALGQAGAQYAGQVGKTLVEPFYEGGRNAIVGRTLNRASSDPATAAARMQASQPTVPGSMPTAATAANDPGLLALENALKGRTGDQFAMRAAGNNAARTTAIDAVAPTITAEQAGDMIRGAMQSRKDAFEALRKRATGPMYTAADMMDPAISGQPIMRSVNAAIASETGPIRSALQTARDSLFLGEGSARRLASSPAEWQAVKRALDAQISAAGNNPALERALMGVRNQVDAELKAGPMFGMADRTFQRMSEPLRPYTPEYGPRVATALERGPYKGPYTQPSEVIPKEFMSRGATGMDEMLAATGMANQPVRQAVAGRLMDDFKAAIRTTADDPLGNKVLSAAGADRWWQANKDMAAKVLTKDQVKAIQTIVDDFAMGARRPQGVAGSNTAQNLASGNMLNAVLRFRQLADSTAAQSVTRPLQFLYKLPEERLQEALVTAMMDPKVASALMVKASPGNAALLAPLLKRAVSPTAVGVATPRQDQ